MRPIFPYTHSMFFFVHRLSIAIQSFGRFLHIRLQLECNKPHRNPPTCTGWSEWCPLEWPLRGALETTTRRQFFRPIFRSVHLLACLCVLGFHRSRDMRIDSHYHIDALPVNWFALLPPPWRLELFAMFHHSHGFCWPLWEEHSSKDCSCGPLCWGFFVLCCAHCLQGLGVCRKLGGFRDDWHDHWKIADQYMCIYIHIIWKIADQRWISVFVPTVFEQLCGWHLSSFSEWISAVEHFFVKTSAEWRNMGSGFLQYGYFSNHPILLGFSTKNHPF